MCTVSTGSPFKTVFEDLYYENSPAIDPKGPTYGASVQQNDGYETKAVRGGNYYFDAESARSPARVFEQVTSTNSLYGFRLVRTAQ